MKKEKVQFENAGVKVISKAKLPSKFGDFTIYAFSNNLDDKEHIAIVKGDVAGKEDVLLRIHSECLTGDVLGSLRCDCGEQLQKSMHYIEKEGRGIVLYLRQEGRGIGLNNKIRAYELQDGGMDTYDANIALGFKPDERSYDVAIHMIKALRVQSIMLLTNNPDKFKALVRAGVKVKSRVSHTGTINEFNKYYLDIKKSKFKHLL